MNRSCNARACRFRRRRFFSQIPVHCPFSSHCSRFVRLSPPAPGSPRFRHPSASFGLLRHPSAFLDSPVSLISVMSRRPEALTSGGKPRARLRKRATSSRVLAANSPLSLRDNRKVRSDMRIVAQGRGKRRCRDGGKSQRCLPSSSARSDSNGAAASLRVATSLAPWLRRRMALILRLSAPLDES